MQQVLNTMREVKIESTVEVYEGYSHFNPQQIQLFEEAKQAAKRAYAPYSKFYVGAALLLENGTIVSGNNQENAVYPSGLCAERVTIFHASSQYPNEPILSMAVTIDYDRIKATNVAFPCGGCRQVLMEYEVKFDRPIELFMIGMNEKVIRLEGIKQLLPFAFTNEMLG